MQKVEPPVRMPRTPASGIVAGKVIVHGVIGELNPGERPRQNGEL